METPRSSLSDTGKRHYEYDWLTVLAMLTIFSYHCARFFNFEDWHVKNAQLSGGMSLYVAVVEQWIMPLFFVLSGISSYYSLADRKGGGYIANRFRRLVIPLVFGIFVILAPVQVWIERVSHGQFAGGFLSFYPHYFDGPYGFGGNFAWMGLHLWYLEMLFVFTLLTFPLFIFFKRERIREKISGAAGFFAKPGAIFLVVVPLFLVEWLVTLQPDGIGMHSFGGWSPVSYLVFLITGYMLAFDPGYTSALERQRYITLILGILATGLMFFFRPDISGLGRFGAYTLSMLVRSLNSWFWLMTFLGFGARYLNFNNGFLKYARVAVLPFYILHQTVIVTIGFYIAKWEMNVLVKYFILAGLAFVSVMAIYDLLVKRIGVLRFLFGMKAKA
jgi:glucan biosynthesis protein C